MPFYNTAGIAIYANCTFCFKIPLETVFLAQKMMINKVYTYEWYILQTSYNIIYFISAILRANP